MKLFISTILIGLTVFGSLIFNNQSQIRFENQQDNSGISASGYVVNSADFSSAYNFALNRESNQTVVTQELPVNKYSISDLFTAPKSEQSKNNRISEYMVFAECKINRFDGPDIIHPFNYFW